MSYQIEFVQCRTLGHGWTITNVVKDEFRRDILHLDCFRCKAKRFDCTTKNGTLWYRSYEYPVGYRLTKDERQPREKYRAEVLKFLHDSAKVS